MTFGICKGGGNFPCRIFPRGTSPRTKLSPHPPSSIAPNTQQSPAPPPPPPALSCKQDNIEGYKCAAAVVRTTVATHPVRWDRRDLHCGSGSAVCAAAEMEMDEAETHPKSEARVDAQRAAVCLEPETRRGREAAAPPLQSRPSPAASGPTASAGSDVGLRPQSAPAEVALTPQRTASAPTEVGMTHPRVAASATDDGVGGTLQRPRSAPLSARAARSGQGPASSPEPRAETSALARLLAKTPSSARAHPGAKPILRRHSAVWFCLRWCLYLCPVWTCASPFACFDGHPRRAL